MITSETNQPATLTSCPGCGSAALGERYFLALQPVISNYRFASSAEARAVTRRDMDLCECTACGLIFNAIFDAGAIPYDERYENCQHFSTGFRSLLEELTHTLTERYLKPGGTVLEVGCGRGDFLKQICEHAGATGAGYDTACDVSDSDERVTLFRRYVTATDVKGQVDLVVCRHVVEHVSEIGDFFRSLHAMAVAGGGAAVYIETPALEWIVEKRAFYDVFYEHCNYFKTDTLRQLAEQAGFEVIDHRLVFSGQYQALELKPEPLKSPFAPVLKPAGLVLRNFAEEIERSRQAVAANLEKAGAARGWAIWGAGAKGVSLASVLSAPPPHFIIDSNPSKQGKFISGSGIPVIAPHDPRIADIPVILVANPNYLSEIHATLGQHGFTPCLVPL
jgi:SAM-dependent methyltransferase